jgi:hypothetical protein
MCVSASGAAADALEAVAGIFSLGPQMGIGEMKLN